MAPAPTPGRPSARTRRFGQLLIAGALAAAALALPACGGDEAARPATPGGNVDPGASGAVGGPVNRAKDVAGRSETRDATIETAVPTAP